jgi:hypothetical protein
MAETLVQFQTPVRAPDGTVYVARACGSQTADGLWHGWLEFTPADGGPTLRSGRETTQPNRADTVYWATGLSPVYLEGALQRAIDGPVVRPVVPMNPPAFDEPAPPTVTSTVPREEAHAVLDPFSVYLKGEAGLRNRLAALSAWHLVNIILEYELSAQPSDVLDRLPHASLVEIIVDGVKHERPAVGGREK